MRSLFTWLDATTATDVSETLAEGSTDLGIDLTGMMDYFMLLLLFGLGLYMLYTVFKLKRECMLFDSKILYPGNCNKDDCLDPDGFMDFITPRMLICALALLLCGGLCALVMWVPGLSNNVTDILVELILPMVVVIWYVIVSRKAAKEFWGQ